MFRNFIIVAIGVLALTMSPLYAAQKSGSGAAGKQQNCHCNGTGTCRIVLELGGGSSCIAGKKDGTDLCTGTCQFVDAPAATVTPGGSQTQTVPKKANQP